MPVDNFSETAFGRHISRRALLRGTVAIAALVAMAALAGPLPTFAANETQQDFLPLSTFLTGHDLDPVLGSRYFAALQKRNPNLVAQMTVLSSPIKQSNVDNMDAFLELPSIDPKLMHHPTRGILAIPTYGPGPDAWGPKPDTMI